MSDPVSSDIPRPGFLYPEELRLTLATMSLDTPEKLANAVGLLQDLDLYRIAEMTLVSQMAQSGYDADPEFSSPSSCFKVTMHGLATRGINTSLVRRFRLWAYVSNAGNSLYRTCTALSRPFEVAGLTRINRIQEQLAPYNVPGMFTLVIDTSKILSNVLNTNPSLTQRSIFDQKKAVFNASTVFDKYRAVVWAENFRLQRLSICEIGLYDIIKDGKLVSRGFKEVASVALPGAEEEHPEPQDEVQYVKHRRVRVSSAETLDPGLAQKGRWERLQRRRVVDTTP